MWLVEMMEMHDIDWELKIQENNDEFHYEIIAHHIFPSDSTSCAINLIIGEDFEPTPMAEILFYQKISKNIGLKDDWPREVFIRDVISHWRLSEVWGEIRKLKQEGVIIIETLKSYFREDSSKDEIQNDIRKYMESQWKHIIHSTYDYTSSPLLHTLNCDKTEEVSFDYEKFISYFESIMDDSLFDLLKGCPLHHNKRKIQSLEKGWAIVADDYSGNNLMLAFEVIYLCINQSKNLDLLSPFEHIVNWCIGGMRSN
jgi:hypothetical protein